MPDPTPTPTDPNQRTPEQRAEYLRLWKDYWKMTSAPKRAELLRANAAAMAHPTINPTEP